MGDTLKSPHSREIHIPIVSYAHDLVYWAIVIVQLHALTNVIKRPI
jgi:hypothetical protein